MGRTTFGKLERDRNKKAKAAAKREKRLAGAEEGDEIEETTHAGDDIPTDELLRRIEELHKRFDAGDISYDDFEETKADLMSRLSID
jgi:hypothetical protein